MALLLLHYLKEEGETQKQDGDNPYNLCSEEGKQTFVNDRKNPKQTLRSCQTSICEFSNHFLVFKSDML